MFDFDCREEVAKIWFMVRNDILDDRQKEDTDTDDGDTGSKEVDGSNC